MKDAIGGIPSASSATDESPSPGPSIRDLTQRAAAELGAFAYRYRWVALALFVVPALVARVWLIHHYPEPDTDAKGHLGIAHALLSDPTNVSLHWVWLPAYHFVLAGLLAIGMTTEGIRELNCGLAILVPALLLLYAQSASDAPHRGPTRHVPLMAAVLCALSPLVNLLGTSAQQETLFTLLVLGAVWALDEERYAIAGAILAVASLIRYETWGGVTLLLALQAIGRIPGLARRMPSALARACRFPLTVSLPSVVALGAFLFAHKLREGTYLGFLRELYRYTHVQRDDMRRALDADLLWFPVKQPMFVFGGAVLVLFALGLRRAWRPSWLLPLGVYGFLLGAYVFKGTLGSARYYESVTPFVALGAAHGACVIGARWRWLAPAAFAIASWQLFTLSEQLCRWTWAPGSEAMVAAAQERAASTHAKADTPPPPPWLGDHAGTRL